jgi:competence protein ComEC
MLLFAAGIGLTIYLPVLPGNSVLAGLLVCAALLWRSPKRTLLACLLLGIAWHIYCGQRLLAVEIPIAWEQRHLQVEGVVSGLPRRGVNVDGSERIRFDLVVEQVLFEQRPLVFERPLSVSLVWHNPGSLAANQRWQLAVELQRPRGLASPGAFDYRAWLLSRGIGASGKVLASDNNRLLGQGDRWLDAARQWYQRQLQRQYGEQPAGGLLLALAIGDKQALSPAQRTVLAATGTSHLMVISGLHIGLCALLGHWLGYCLASWRPVWVQNGTARWSAALGSLLLAAGYAALAGFSLPTVRALLMLLVFVCARVLARETSSARVLSLALVVVLLREPLAVIDTGFWLSFGAVAILLVPGRRRVDGRGKWWATLGLQFRLLVGMLPLMALLVGQSSAIAPLVNLLAIPLLGFTVVPVLLAGMLLLPLLPGIGHGLLELVNQLLNFYWMGLSTIAALAGSWSVGTLYPRPAAVCLAGVAALLFLMPRGFPGRMAWPLLLLPLAMPATKRSDGLDVYMLDVGQGTAVVVQTRNHVMLYDAGPAYPGGFDAASSVVLPFLRRQGIATVDRLLVSHRDNDHSGGAASLLAGIKVREWMAPLPLPGLGNPDTYCRAGMQWQWDGVTFSVLHPGPVLPRQSNNHSCVLLIESPDLRVLLSGDIERSIELQLTRRHGHGLQADVLMLPHHGSDSSSSHDFTWFTRPAVAVASVGYRNRFGHPTVAVQRRYQALGAAVVSTDQAGALHFANSAQYRPWRWFYTRYWQHYPCSLAGDAQHNWLFTGLQRFSISLPGCESSVFDAVDGAFLW